MQQWKDGIGLLAIALAAAVLVGRNSPKNLAVIDGGDAASNPEADRLEALGRNRRLRWGVRLVIVSVVLQGIAQLIPSEAP